MMNRRGLDVAVLQLFGELEEKGLLNLRFKWVVAVNGLYALFSVPVANYAIRHREKYSSVQRFRLACRMINHMRRCSRTATRVYGVENIPKDKGVIFYSNHQGKYDALGILLALRRPCGVLWEKKQANRLLSRQVCRLLEGVDIDLTDPREKVRSIHRVTEAVQGGRDFLIFPEGGYTNNHNELQQFQSGCFSCSLRSKGPMVPVVIYDSYKAMNSNTFEKVITQVHFLKAIFYEEYGGLTKQQLAELVKSRIAEKLEEIKSGLYTDGKPDLVIGKA